MLEGPWELLLALVAAFCIGISKAGFSGTSLLAVAIFTHLYGAKAQAGLALPLLILADLVVYPVFRKHGSWKDVWRLLPAALVGLAVGWWMMGLIPGTISERSARRIIGGLIMLMLAMQALRAWKPGLLERMADHHAFGTGAGVAGGVTTMLANAAGPVIQLYLLSRRLPKMEMIGIGARFFLLVNLIKVPINGQLDLIHRQSLLENLKLAPAIVAGIYIGRGLLKRVPQRAFEWMILVFAALAALRMLW